jgi:hypothetical protein
MSRKIRLAQLTGHCIIYVKAYSLCNGLQKKRPKKGGLEREKLKQLAGREGNLMILWDLIIQ